MPPSSSPRPSPLDLNAELVRIIRDAAAAPLLPSVRTRFFERVDALLRDEPGALGPATIARAVRKAQREFLAIDDASPVVDGRR
jgi:hypothetical protein